MATINRREKGAITHGTRGNSKLARKLIDFALLTKEGITPGATDVFQCLDIPANSVIHAANLVVIKAESGNPTAEVAMACGATALSAAATVAATGARTPFVTATAKTAAEVVTLTSSVAALTNAQIEVSVLYTDLN